MGIMVTAKPEEPSAEKVRCVRADLTETCEVSDVLLTINSRFSRILFQVCNTRPRKRGLLGRGVSVGTFFCSTHFDPEQEIDISCLKNLGSTLNAMPNLNQIHALIEHYGPSVFFHPNEIYLPSSVQWFLKNGALLYEGGDGGEVIDYKGSNLPRGGTNDGAFWIDLPSDDGKASSDLKKGNIESAELYVHVKLALGGTFTDIAMWVFCPFNEPVTIKVPEHCDEKDRRTCGGLGTLHASCEQFHRRAMVCFLLSA